jgi:hypothetical protein
MAPSEDGLNPSETYSYQIFPEKFETKYFGAPRKIHDYTESLVFKSIVTNEVIM